MSTSNTAATAQNNPNSYPAALVQIDSELSKVLAITDLYKFWINKCYGAEGEWIDRGIQNTICVLSRKVKQHLQKAKEIAYQAGVKESLFYEDIRFAEENIKILCVPHHAIGQSEVMALSIINDDFLNILQSARNYIAENIEKHQSLVKPCNLDRNQAICSRFGSSEYKISDRLDIAYSIIAMLKQNTEKCFSNSDWVIAELRAVSSELYSILSSNTDEYLVSAIRDALDHLCFLEKTLNSSIGLGESDKSPIYSILVEAESATHNAASAARRNHAIKILQQGGALDNLLH